MVHLRRFIVLFDILIFRICCSQSETEGLYFENGDWVTDKASMIAKPGPCSIEVRDASLTQQEFLERYAHKRPVVIRGKTDNKKFRKLCSKEALLRDHGHKMIRLSSANTYSYRKVDVTLRKYVEEIMQPQQLYKMGNETLYWFGDNNYEEWGSIFEQYIPPPYSLPKHSPIYSFGLAGAGTGVPFHFHGPGFGEVIYGRKRWFLYPPNKTPKFHPDKTTLLWLVEEYPKLYGIEAPIECTIGPGDIIYFPDRWWHGTLNIDVSVFISTFLGPS